MAVAERWLSESRRLGIGSGAALAIMLLLVFLHFVLRLGFATDAAIPDLLTVVLLLGARRVRTGTAACIGFTLGMLEDAFTLAAFGTNTLAMVLTGILGVQTRVFFVSVTSLSFHIAYFGAGKWLRDFFHWILQVRAGPAAGFVEAMVLTGVPAALYAALTGVLLVKLIGSSGEGES